MAYCVELSRKAQRQFAGFSRDVQKRVATAIDGLARDPRPPGARKLSGDENAFRVRVGDYRVLYEIQDEILIVLVLRMGHRREVYRRRA